MNRYALWKCTVIAVALLVGFIHSLSNLFPGAPAVQVSSSMAGVKLGSVLLSQAQAALKEAGIGYSGEGRRLAERTSTRASTRCSTAFAC